MEDTHKYDDKRTDGTDQAQGRNDYNPNVHRPDHESAINLPRQPTYELFQIIEHIEGKFNLPPSDHPQ
jgi:hypothetical protein